MSPKDLLVTTTSSLEGITIKRYLKPVSAHIVAGTNLFTDFFGGLTDIFGGRSNSYQRELISLYNEAIERIKVAAYEIGGNAVIGLKVDMDEISGKGKSMFMLTAVGTAVFIERDPTDKINTIYENSKLENVGLDRLKTLEKRKHFISESSKDSLKLTDENWDFITQNQVHEIFPFLLKKFSEALQQDQYSQGTADKFKNQFLDFLQGLNEETRLNTLYQAVTNEKSELLIKKLYEIMSSLHLFNHERILKLLGNADFDIQKRGVHMATMNKDFYNAEDQKNLKELVDLISSTFPERGIKSSKKQLLSSKEKDVWTCECGKTSDINEYCSGCKKDIYGFKSSETNPRAADVILSDKIELLSECLL